MVWEAPTEPPKVIFAGGGGVGVVGNPVFSKPKSTSSTDGITTSTIFSGGALLAVDVVSGGFGYKYAPVTTLNDTSGKGAGAHLVAIVGVTSTQTIKFEK